MGGREVMFFGKVVGVWFWWFLSKFWRMGEMFKEKFTWVGREVKGIFVEVGKCLYN